MIFQFRLFQSPIHWGNPFEAISYSTVCVRNLLDCLLPVRNSHFSIRTSSCLVALNHERAEEEKRGLVRWLRPEYQAPDAAPTQTELAGTTATTQPRTKNREPRTAIPWPKALPAQIAAVRSALETLSVPADAAAIAKLFKGARKDRIEAILESLQALGHAHEVEDGRYSA